MSPSAAHAPTPSDTDGGYVTEQEIQVKIKTLLWERVGYVRRGLEDRIAAVDAELRKLGYRVERPRAEPLPPVVEEAEEVEEEVVASESEPVPAKPKREPALKVRRRRAERS